MNIPVWLAENRLIPDALIRWGIRRLHRARLKRAERTDPEERLNEKMRFIGELKNSPVAILTGKPKEQHYELTPAFFQHVLGKRMKYSGCYWTSGTDSLDHAEEDMLSLTCERAELIDGMDILELGCGWGSLSIWMAEKYPNSRVTTVSNSAPQGEFIRNITAERGLDNLIVMTADMNDFDTEQRFDRVVSIEMFEHMRNWGVLLHRISDWLKPDGKFFMHVFTHRRIAYPFEEGKKAGWMARLFFSGGIMPSDDLVLYFQDRLSIEKHWRVNGMHYRKTAEAWLKNMDAHRNEILPVLDGIYGKNRSRRWFQRWRMFFMACAELWGFDQGREWLVSHYLLKKRNDSIE